VVAAAPVVAVLLAFSLFLTLLRQSRPVAGGSQPPPPAPSDRYPAEAPTASMMFTTADARELAAGAVPRPPAPPIALPAAPAQADLPDRDSDPTPDAPAEALDAQAAQAADAAQAAEAADAPETARTQEITELAADPVDAVQDPGIAATREEPALAATAPETRAPQTPDVTSPATITDEAVGQPAPSAEVTPESAEIAPEPTPEPEAEAAAEVPSATVAEASAEPEPESAPEPEPTQPPAPAPQAIRYASSAAAEQFANEDWEAEVDPALAGQVYPVLTSDPDIEVPPLQPGQSQDLEDDAPSFATAPFASVPRLNRVRVTPTPPTDDADED
jgi:nicotinate-nucleotide--dimethylbenzimidazole phosphoribosyltransferase